MTYSILSRYLFNDFSSFIFEETALTCTVWNACARFFAPRSLIILFECSGNHCGSITYELSYDMIHIIWINQLDFFFKSLRFLSRAVRQLHPLSATFNFSLKSFKKPIVWKIFYEKLRICFGMNRLICYLKWWTQYVKLKGICPCNPCNMLNMLDSPSTFSTCFCPVSRTDEHGRKQINFEYILQWGPLRVPHDSWIKPKFKFFQNFSRFWLIFKIFEVFNLSSFKSTTFI